MISGTLTLEAFFVKAHHGRMEVFDCERYSDGCLAMFDRGWRGNRGCGVSATIRRCSAGLSRARVAICSVLGRGQAAWTLHPVFSSLSCFAQGSAL